MLMGRITLHTNQINVSERSVLWQIDTEETGVWSNGDNVGYSLHGTTFTSTLVIESDVLADFTNGWPTGFFSEIFSHGKQCSVGFDVKSCPALAPHVVEGNCQYKGVKVVEVSCQHEFHGTS